MLSSLYDFVWQQKGNSEIVVKGDISGQLLASIKESVFIKHIYIKMDSGTLRLTWLTTSISVFIGTLVW